MPPTPLNICLTPFRPVGNPFKSFSELIINNKGLIMIIEWKLSHRLIFYKINTAHSSPENVLQFLISWTWGKTPISRSIERVARWVKKLPKIVILLNWSIDLIQSSCLSRCKRLQFLMLSYALYLLVSVTQGLLFILFEKLQSERIIFDCQASQLNYWCN